MAPIGDGSIMVSDVDRRPATWVAKRAARRRRLVWLGLALFLLLAGLVLALALGHRLSLAASAFFLAFVFAAKPHAEGFVDRTLNWTRGARAEQAVGETLNELRSDGWYVAHDLDQAGEGNIDHLVSGPRGVYLIETKARRYEHRHLVKAKRQAAKVHDDLGVWVTPVVCLHERRGEPFHAPRVWVVPRQHLLGWLLAQHNRPVGPIDSLALQPTGRGDRQGPLGVGYTHRFGEVVKHPRSSARRKTVYGWPCEVDAPPPRGQDGLVSLRGAGGPLIQLRRAP